MIVRKRDISDRRMVRIWLTDAGKELETVLPPMALNLQKKAMAGFDDHEREQFSQLIDRAIANRS